MILKSNKGVFGAVQGFLILVVVCYCWLGVTVYDLLPYLPEQLSLFDNEHGDKKALSRSLDAINDHYGDMVVGSALLEGMGNFILDRIAFGGVKDLYDLYETSPAEPWSYWRIVDTEEIIRRYK